MTRWARSGSTQKHKKQPGDATPWSEFKNKGVQKNSSVKQEIHKNKKHKKRKYSEKSDVSQHLHKSVEENANGAKLCNDNEELQPSPKKLKQSGSFHLKDKKTKKKKNRSELDVEKCSTDCSISKSDERSDSLNSNKSKDMIQNTKNNVEHTVLKRDKIKKKFLKQHNKTDDKINSDNLTDNLSLNNASTSKKNKYLERIKKKRMENGIFLLPSKIERRLYNIKRRLREKGLPPAVLKDIIRKERRLEELKFRKTFNTSKPCFNCRKPGHILADCPEKQGSSKQQTGICFKCGSAEHTSFKCPNKVQGFPYANCFICKDQGHISRDCPKNKHGIYPKGGRCNLCGNVNHLKKDCPSLIKKENEESTITLSTMNEATSVDEEVMEKKNKKPKNTVTKPKIVKF